MRHFCVLALAAVAIVACKPQEQILATWVGAPEDKLVSIWGAPSESFKTDDGIQVLVYSKPAGEAPSVVNADGLIVPASGREAPTCETTFVIDAGRVVSYTSGADC